MPTRASISRDEGGGGGVGVGVTGAWTTTDNLSLSRGPHELGPGYGVGQARIKFFTFCTP
jgi:hypothetical protein